MKHLGKAAHLLLGHWVFVRNERAGGLLENFFISAVVAILAIRLYLRYAAGTPLTTQVTLRVTAGPTVAELHFAHMLWGGLLMLVAIILLLAFLSRFAKEVAAVLGGVGFGAFIDELGKFITQNNDYFFEPAFALIYLSFVLLFLAVRAIQRPHTLSPRDAMANALEVAKQTVTRETSPEDRAHALLLLQRAQATGPTAEMLREMLVHMEAPYQQSFHLLNRTKRLLHRLYQRLLRTRWFPGAVIAFFVFQSVSSLYETLATVTWLEALIAWLLAGGLAALAVYIFRRRPASYQLLGFVGIILVALLVTWALLSFHRQPPEAMSDWLQPVSEPLEAGTGLRHRLINLVGLLQFISPTVSSVLVVFGGLSIWHSRHAAYLMFYYAVLLSILLTQFFIFYEDQVLGMVGLLPNLLILVTLRFLIREEEREELTASEVPARDELLPYPETGRADG